MRRMIATGTDTPVKERLRLLHTLAWELERLG